MKDPNLRIVEVDYNVPHVYDQGHIPGSILIDWKRDLNDPLQRNILNKSAFESLMSKLGIGNDHTIVLYGELDNWFAAFAFWMLKLYGHKDARLMNGDRDTWIAENGSMTKDIPKFSTASYIAKDPDPSLRVFLNNVRQSLGKSKIALVDVRSPKEYTGEVTAPAEYPTEHAQRGGHIPGAVNVPWSQAVRDDGRFKSAEELRQLYSGKSVTPDKEVITYCRIGERSSHTWFVLKYLLGLPRVANYDGSWTEWGNMIGNPIER